MDPLFNQAKLMYPNASDEEIQMSLADIRQKMPPGSSDNDIVQAANKIGESQKSGDWQKGLATEAVKQKFQLGDYSPEKRTALQDQVASSASPIAAGFAGFGAGLRGGDVASGFKTAMDASQGKAKGALDAFDKARQQGMQDTEFERTERDDASNQEKLKREQDPTSPESKIAQDAAIAMGVKPEIAAKLTAAKFKDMSPSFQKIYEIKEKGLDRQERSKDRQLQRESMQYNRDEARREKAEQKAKPSDKQIEAFTDIDNAASDLENLLSKVEGKSGWTGPVDGRVPDMLVGDDQVAWRSALGKYKDAYRKAITGAGAGPTEIAMLEKRLPSETDTYENFKAKAQEAQKELLRRRENLSTNLTKGGKNVDQFKKESVPQAETKVVNGKTYRKVQGGWEEVE